MPHLLISSLRDCTRELTKLLAEQSIERTKNIDICHVMQQIIDMEETITENIDPSRREVILMNFFHESLSKVVNFITAGRFDTAADEDWVAVLTVLAAVRHFALGLADNALHSKLSSLCNFFSAVGRGMEDTIHKECIPAEGRSAVILDMFAAIGDNLNEWMEETHRDDMFFNHDALQTLIKLLKQPE